MKGKEECKARIARRLSWVNTSGVWRDAFIEAANVCWRKDVNRTFMGVGRKFTFVGGKGKSFLSGVIVLTRL